MRSLAKDNGMKTHFDSLKCLLLLSIFTLGGWSGTSIADKVTLDSGGHKLKGTLCRPGGTGPFPAVVYHHGGGGNAIGGSPEDTCRALAKAGFIGLSLIRRSTKPLQGHLEDAEVAVDYIKQRDEVDSGRIGVIGFSRGGLLAWQQAARRNDLAALVIMGVAVNRQLNFADAGNIPAPVLLLVSKNDTGSRYTKGRNTLKFTRRAADALKQAGRDIEFIVYPSFRNDGHTLFFEVRSEYWKDVTRFLKSHL